MDIEQVVAELIERIRSERSLTRDKEALRQVLAEHADHPPIAIARRAQSMISEFLSHNDLDYAQGAALLANLVFLNAGDEASSLQSGYDFSSIRFMLANDVAAYESLRGQFAGLFSRTKELGLDALAVRSATAMADCTYFAASCEPVDGRRDAILNVLIHDLLVVTDAVKASAERPDTASPDFARFVSLAANAYALIEERRQRLPAPYFCADEGSAADFDARMARLASAIEEMVPVDFTFGPEYGADKSADIAAKLAAFSKRSGSDEKARARLRASLLHA